MTIALLATKNLGKAKAWQVWHAGAWHVVMVERGHSRSLGDHQLDDDGDDDDA